MASEREKGYLAEVVFGFIREKIHTTGSPGTITENLPSPNSIKFLSKDELSTIIIDMI